MWIVFGYARLAGWLFLHTFMKHASKHFEPQPTLSSLRNVSRLFWVLFDTRPSEQNALNEVKEKNNKWWLHTFFVSTCVRHQRTPIYAHVKSWVDSSHFSKRSLLIFPPLRLWLWCMCTSREWMDAFLILTHVFTCKQIVISCSLPDLFIKILCKKVATTGNRPNFDPVLFFSRRIWVFFLERTRVTHGNRHVSHVRSCVCVWLCSCMW